MMEASTTPTTMDNFTRGLNSFLAQAPEKWTVFGKSRSVFMLRKTYS